MNRLQRHRASQLLAFVGICWLVLAVDLLTPGPLALFGVHPRTMAGLSGILFAPLLHGGVAHLMANSVPLLVLGGLIILADERRFLAAVLWSSLGAGLGAWLLGPTNSVHVGASGIVFGFLGFLLTRGFFARRVWLILLSLAVAALWGGLVFGVLPGQAGVSWQSHAGGFLGGVLAARGAAGARRSGGRLSGGQGGWFRPRPAKQRTRA